MKKTVPVLLVLLISILIGAILASVLETIIAPLQPIPWLWICIFLITSFKASILIFGAIYTKDN